MDLGKRWVMGGISEGGFKLSDKASLVFSGKLSLENNGGFASIRMKPTKLDLGDTKGIAIEARGDGRTYWVDLRIKDQPSATSYRAYLPTTAGEWTVTKLSFDEFKLQAYGMGVPSKALDPELIHSVGFTIADKKAGAFNLEVKTVKAYSKENDEAKKSDGDIVDVAKAAGSFHTLLAAAAAAGLDGALSGDGPLTVLAPTDEAFKKLPAGVVEKLLLPENKEQLVAILKYHVIEGKVTLAKALEVREAATLEGSKIPFRFEKGRVLVGAATLQTADINATNGIIHVIDEVLIPQTKPTEPLNASQLMELAIERGVPLFNKGDFGGCEGIYEVTIEALRTMKDVPKSSQKILTQALTEARGVDSSRARCWILREAIDATWKSLEP